MEDKKPVILIVDDIEEYLDSLENALRDEYRIIKARTLREAKENTSKNIDIALVDIRLSEEDRKNRDGLVYLEWVKMNYPSIPVIMMSAYQEFDLAVDALNLGAKYFLKKPINIIELKGVLKSFLKEK